MEEQPVETTLYSLSESAPRPLDRRDDERHLTLFRVGTVTIGDRRELCLIKNVSAGGMLVRAYCVMQPGTRLSVELKRGEQIQGSVSWVRDNNVGIEFDERIDVVELLSSSMDGPRPRMPRVELSCVMSVRQGADVRGVYARDISQGGMKIETDHELELGSDIVVTMPGMAPHAGLVRWRDGKFYGITFNRLLALSEVVEWLQSQREQLRAAS